MPRGFDLIRSLLRPAAGRTAAQASPRDAVASLFGPLEIQVLEALWSEPQATSVRALQERFPRVAYTTLMTTLDRLYKKGVLERERQGRAFLYRTRATREDLDGDLASGAIDGLLGSSPSRAALRPLLSSFVEAVSRRDAELLDELEQMIRSQRGQRDARGSRGRGR
jgi:predicted transcriptional regulator